MPGSRKMVSKDITEQQIFHVIYMNSTTSNNINVMKKLIQKQDLSPDGVPSTDICSKKKQELTAAKKYKKCMKNCSFTQKFKYPTS